jgi:hypothetical protein
LIRPADLSDEPALIEIDGIAGANRVRNGCQGGQHHHEHRNTHFPLPPRRRSNCDFLIALLKLAAARRATPSMRLIAQAARSITGAKLD